MATQARVVLKIPARIVGAGNIRVTLENGVYIISDQGGANGAGAPVSTVAGLPPPTVVGARRYVTNAVSSAFGSVVMDGGSLMVPVYSDGTRWRVG
jgi:hypothetical protein